MSTEIEELFSDPTLTALLDWTKKTGLWNGDAISVEECPVFKKNLEEKILEIFLSSASHTQSWHDMVANFARLGTTGNSRTLLEKEIKELHPNKNVFVAHSTFGKSASKFWKKHKMAILIGVGVTAAVATFVIVSACTGGAAAAAAGGAAIGTQGGNKKKEKKKEGMAHPPPHKPSSPPPAQKPLPEPQKSNPAPSLSLPALQKAAFFSTFPHFDFDVLQKLFHAGEKSSPFELEGKKFPHQQIGFINGIATSFKEATSHGTYIQSLAKGQHVEGVYNQTHSAAVDVLGSLGLMIQGSSFTTAKELFRLWTRFHETHLNDPTAKYLQFCHSKGALDVKNELMFLSKEIRDRIIVVAIAPAAVVSRELCYKSFNYASRRDLVPYLETGAVSLLDGHETGISQRTETAINHRNQLILLDPHPDANLLDHDFESPTFTPQIIQHLIDYAEHEGRYP